MCFECDAADASISSEASTVLLCVGIVLVILLAIAAHRLYRGYAERGERKDAGEMRWVKPSFTAGGLSAYDTPGTIPTNYGKDVLVGFLKTLVLDILIYKETVYSEQHNESNESNESNEYARHRAAAACVRRMRVHVGPARRAAAPRRNA
jgi:hypothetical protein